MVAMNLGQVQFLYRSPLYNTFLKRRFTQQLHLANQSPGNRGEIIRVLLESVKVGSVEHNELISAQIIEDDCKAVAREAVVVMVHPKG